MQSKLIYKKGSFQIPCFVINGTLKYTLAGQLTNEDYVAAASANKFNCFGQFTDCQEVLH